MTYFYYYCICERRIRVGEWETSVDFPPNKTHIKTWLDSMTSLTFVKFTRKKNESLVERFLNLYHQLLSFLYSWMNQLTSSMIPAVVLDSGALHQKIDKFLQNISKSPSVENGIAFRTILRSFLIENWTIQRFLVEVFLSSFNFLDEELLWHRCRAGVPVTICGSGGCCWFSKFGCSLIS